MGGRLGDGVALASVPRWERGRRVLWRPLPFRNALHPREDLGGERQTDRQTDRRQTDRQTVRLVIGPVSCIPPPWPTFSTSSTISSTMMFWYLMLTMDATDSLSGRMRVGPHTTPRLLAFIRLRSEYDATLHTHTHTHTHTAFVIQ